MLVCDGRLCFIPDRGRHLRPKITGVPMGDIFILPLRRISDRPIAVYVRPAATKSKRGWFARWRAAFAFPAREDSHCIYELDSFRDDDGQAFNGRR